MGWVVAWQLLYSRDSGDLGGCGLLSVWCVLRLVWVTCCGVGWLYCFFAVWVYVRFCVVASGSWCLVALWVGGGGGWVCSWLLLFTDE